MKKEPALSTTFTEITYEFLTETKLRNLLSIFAGVALIGCEVAVVTPVPPTPELDTKIEQTAAQLNAAAGRRLGTELTIIGAEKVGSELQINLRIAQGLADRVRGTSRGELMLSVERLWRPSLCDDPDLRSIVELGGQINTRFEDPIRRHLFEIETDFC